MNFWTKGIAVVKNVFGGSTLSADKVFTSVAKGIDNLGFTEQERATFAKDMAEGLANYTIDTLGESSDRSFDIHCGLVYAFDVKRPHVC